MASLRAKLGPLRFKPADLVHHMLEIKIQGRPLELILGHNDLAAAQPAQDAAFFLEFGHIIDRPPEIGRHPICIPTHGGVGDINHFRQRGFPKIKDLDRTFILKQGEHMLAL
jgi:hypothetical protein